MLVDGELRIEDSFDFYGIVMTGVKNQARTRLEDDVRIHGAIMANDELRFNDGASLQYSGCVIQRAMASCGSSGRLWFLPRINDVSAIG